MVRMVRSLADRIFQLWDWPLQAVHVRAVHINVEHSLQAHEPPQQRQEGVRAERVLGHVEHRQRRNVVPDPMFF